MKKIICLVLSLVMILSSVSVFAADEIKIVIDGKNLSMDQSPIIVDGRTLVPLRAIFEAVGALVEWDDATKCATGIKDGNEIKIQIDNTVAKVNGNDVTLDVPACIVNSRTLVPVRFISESLGCKVEWEDATKTVKITSNKAEKVFELSFDDLTSFEAEKDFTIGGVYKKENVSLSSEFDHTTTVGKSLKMGNISSSSDRLKILKAFEGATEGDLYKISLWVMTDADTNKVSPLPAAW